MFYFFYDLFLFLASLFYLPFYALRGRVHADILMRLGVFKKSTFAPLDGKDVVWIHAVSVGEARAAESLIRLIRRDWPQKRIVVSTVTPTGQAIVKTLLEQNEIAFYAPLDITFAVNKFLRFIAPNLLIIMETELWPNLIRLTRKRKVPVVVVNGRISDRSFKGYERLKFLFEGIFRQINLFCVQNEESLQRIIALGAPAGRVKATGNIKFDISPDLKESTAFVRLKKSINGNLLFIAGSTHDNEEEMIVEIYRSLRRDFTSLRLLLAPRHVERVDKIRRMIRVAGLEAVNLSRMAQFSSVQVGIVNTIGDLSSLYRLSSVVFIGGSLVKKGGHNPIEPALFGKPVIFGKYMENFKEIRDVFLKENAALEVDSPQGLEYELRRLLASPLERKALGDRARELIAKNRGAAERTFFMVREMVQG